MNLNKIKVYLLLCFIVFKAKWLIGKEV